MIDLDDLINTCKDIKDDIGVDKDDKPIVGKGFNYGVIDTCNRIVNHFTEVERGKDMDLAIKADKEPSNGEWIFHDEVIG